MKVTAYSSVGEYPGIPDSLLTEDGAVRGAPHAGPWVRCEPVEVPDGNTAIAVTIGCLEPFPSGSLETWRARRSQELIVEAQSCPDPLRALSLAARAASLAGPGAAALVRRVAEGRAEGESFEDAWKRLRAQPAR